MKFNEKPYAYAVFDPRGFGLNLFFQEAKAVDHTALEEGRYYKGLYLPIEEPRALGELGKPSDIEVIAERLAKVEEGLTRLAVPADNFGSLLTRLDAVDARLDTQSELRVRSNRTLDQRIDKVAEIIGERVSGLVDEIAAARDSAKRAHERLDDFGARRTADIKTEPAFPTGGASTAEAAAEAVLPVPQRGDRVRLEGATTQGTQQPILPGWYDVVGAEQISFQIKVRAPEGFPDAFWWIANDSPGLKEVRHAENT